MNKLIYLKSENKCREWSDREKPEDSPWYFGGTKRLNQLMDAYNAHIASLPRYPVVGEHNWKDGQELELNVDYNVSRTIYKDDSGVLQTRTVIIPLQQEREDGWKKRLTEEVPSFLLNDAGTVINWIDKNYTLTRRNDKEAKK